MARTVSIIADATSGRFFVAEANGTRIPLNRDGYSTDKNALRALARHYDFKAVPGCPYAYSIEATDREISPAGHDRACIVADHEVAVMQREAAEIPAREAAAAVAQDAAPAPAVEAAPVALSAPQPVRTSRRSIFGAIFGAGAFAALGAPAVAARPALRGGDANRLPDHAAFWSRLPLPFSPAEAWKLLAPEVQAEIGSAIITMHLADYIHGDGMADADQFHDVALRDEASGVANHILNRMGDRLWSLFPDLYGPDGDHPRWALDSGLAA
ncbi:hypothetical protein [Methylobacterium indicum]|uniref:hypothetical protein n=1 Tax=Methylobacterium indicum TaxID=1775910 RepID=UPI000AEEE734|nr:hypothetical protein [Methylobacterium indicum]